jgi:hypothetical protein
MPRRETSRQLQQMTNAPDSLMDRRCPYATSFRYQRTQPRTISLVLPGCLATAVAAISGQNRHMADFNIPNFVGFEAWLRATRFW